MKHPLLLACSAAVLLAGASAFAAAPAADFHEWAPTPPMGWNSWDCFGTTVTETQIKAQTDFMAEKLKSHGWEYIVVDIQWYEPGAKGHDYKPDAKLAMDEFSRLVPAPEKFPSAANGRGFKALSDYVHAKGLKFGIHMMRGISRQAVKLNTPIKGAPQRAADIADTSSTCSWNPDMYGVDMSKPGAQAYYDSLMEQVASWGVDYIKVDDLSRPYHQAEIEALRKAIAKTGRPIVLSTSPGETPLSAGPHVNQHANLWRISDDFWDSWPALLSQFKRLHDWTPHRRPGAWPDADMLPIGVVEFGRPTRFTRDEQFTLMTLWSIARSPLMHGGDMTWTDDFTLSLLTNDEVIAVNQRSENNRQLFRTDDGLVAWVADVPGSADKYLAVFNTREPYASEPAIFTSDVITRHTPGHGVAIDVEITGPKRLHLVADEVDDIHGDHVIWSEPRLVGPAGELKLTDLKWAAASTGWGQVSTKVATSGQPQRIGGKPVPYGISAHAEAHIQIDLPPGYTRFKTFAALDDVAVGHDRGATVRFSVFTGEAGPATVRVPLARLGIEGEALVRDLWTRTNLPSVSGELAVEVPSHGARLFRLRPAARP